MGDLLLAFAEHLSLETTLHQTLDSWGRQLSGFDLDADLVRLTKARLVLQARLRGRFNGEIDRIDGVFPGIGVGDMMQAKGGLGKPDGFLFNPPFGVVKDAGECGWSAGSINAAALFLAELVTHKKASAPIFRDPAGSAALRFALRGLSKSPPEPGRVGAITSRLAASMHGRM